MFEWKAIGDVLTVHTGKQLNRSGLSDVGKYPVINGGRTPSGYTDSYNENKNSITISQGGESAGFVNWIDTAFWAGAHCYIVENKSNQNLRFLFHLLKTYEYVIMESKQGAGIPGLNRKNLYSILVPIPSIEEQIHIVSILDTFTDSIENLKLQIVQRRKQYEFYRYQLLDLEGKEGVEMLKLGEACEIRRGIRVVKKQLKENAQYPVFQNSIAPMGYYDQFNRNGNMPYIICAGSSSGSVGYCCTPFWAADDCFTIESSKVDTRYTYYALKTNNNNLFRLVRKGSMPRLPHEAIDNMIIPIPSLEEQQRIVSILDTFEASISNLEAQLEQRQKQYEYYRNKLLTFE